VSQRRHILLIGLNLNAALGIGPYLLQAYLGTDAELSGELDVQVRYYDQFADPACVAAAVLALDPWLVGYSTYCWSAGTLMDVAQRVRAARPAAIQVVGGPHVAGQEVALMEQNLATDYLVSGEGEVTFHALLRMLIYEDRAPSDIRGIAHRVHGRIVINDSRPLIPDLDVIPSPILSGLIPLDRVSSGLGAYQSYRGCVFDCAFCSWGPRRVRSFSMERIEAELRLLCRAPLKWVWFCDAVFNLDQRRTERIMDILRRVLDEGSEIVFCLELDVELLTNDQIAFFAAYPDNFMLNMGLQTVTDEALAAARRKFHRERYSDRMRSLVEGASGIACQVDVIFGLPGDDYAGTLASLDFALGLGVAHIEYQNLMVLPGTHFFCETERWGIRCNPYQSHLVSSTTSYSADDMGRAAVLAVGVSFFNTGLLAGCLKRIQSVYGHGPASFIARFSRWFMACFELPTAILQIQSAALPAILDSRNRSAELTRQRTVLLSAFFNELARNAGDPSTDAELSALLQRNYARALILAPSEERTSTELVPVPAEFGEKRRTRQRPSDTIDEIHLGTVRHDEQSGHIDEDA